MWRLLVDASDFTGKEADWVIRRLAELLGREPPEFVQERSREESANEDNAGIR